MRRVLISLFIVGILAGSAVCFGQGAIESPVESAEVAVAVVPDGVELPVELAKQFDRLFDPNEVFLTGAFCEKLAAYTKGLPGESARKMASADVSRQRDLSIRREIEGRLRRGLGSAHLEVRRRAALALNAIGDNTGVPVMIESISATDAGDRALVVIALRKMKDRRAIDALIKAADDKVSHIRCIAIEALGEMRAEEAYEVIVKHLTDKEAVKGTDVLMLPAESSCFALGELGEKKAVPLLIKALADVVLKDEAAAALEKIKLGGGRFIGPGRQGESFGMDVKKWTDWWHWEDLDGTAVMVRLYRDWKADPALYETVSVKIKDHLINFESLRGGSDAVVVILAAEQTDDFVAKVLKNHLIARKWSAKLKISLPDYRTPPPDVTDWVLQDAFGNPIEDANVELFLHAFVSEEFRIKLGEYVLHDKLTLFDNKRMSRRFDFVVYHPNYGTVEMFSPFINKPRLLLPLAHNQSAAYQRAIRGVVTDQDGLPVEGAKVDCRHVRTVGRGLIDTRNDQYWVLTDSEGFFSLYMIPDEQRQERRGYLIPPKSTYTVRISPPKGSSLLTFEGPVVNGKDCTITLSTAGHEHRFVFKDSEGVLTEREHLQRITLIVDRPDNTKVTFKYTEWNDRTLFPLGTYTAQMNSPRTRHNIRKFNFKPIEVTEDSPVEIMFTLDDPFVYSGRVVHGITGEPMAGVYVMTLESTSSNRIADITPTQWEDIRQLGDDLQNLWAKPLKPLLCTHSPSGLVRTDQNGYYTFTPHPGRKFYTFLAFEEHYVPVSKLMYGSEVITDSINSMPDMKLFPAAKVLCNIRIDQEHASVLPEWIVDKSNSPPWIDDLLAQDDRRTWKLRYNGWLNTNEPQYIYVPADVTMKMMFRPPYDMQLCNFTTDQTFNLSHAEVFDLGDIRFEPTLKIYLKVVDSAGRSIEGVHVRKHVGNTESAGHSSDENGLTMFCLPPFTEGEFFVSYDKRADPHIHLREEIPFKISDYSDDGNVFTLELSDEILYYLFDVDSPPINNSSGGVWSTGDPVKVRIISIE